MPNSPEREGSPRLLTIDQIAEKHGVSRSSVHTYRRGGTFPRPVPVEGTTRVLFDAEEVAAWFTANPKQQGKRTDLATKQQQGEPDVINEQASARTTVSLTPTHWESLRTQARLKAWVEARQMGMTVEQCDRIADAAFDGVRELAEEWARQQAEEPTDG